MMFFRPDIDNFYFQLQTRLTVFYDIGIWQAQFFFLFPLFFSVIECVKFRCRKGNDFLLITASRRYKPFISASDVQQTPKGHVFVDRRLMLAEYDHFSSRVKRNIILKIHIDRIVYTEFPNLRSFRQRLIMDCIKKRDLVRFCWFVLIEQIYKDTVFNFSVFFSCHKLSFHVHE